jgi:hypothetical protein
MRNGAAFTNLISLLDKSLYRKLADPMRLRIVNQTNGDLFVVALGIGKDGAKTVLGLRTRTE